MDIFISMGGLKNNIVVLAREYISYLEMCFGLLLLIIDWRLMGKLSNELSQGFMPSVSEELFH